MRLDEFKTRRLCIERHRPLSFVLFEKLSSVKHLRWHLNFELTFLLVRKHQWGARNYCYFAVLIANSLDMRKVQSLANFSFPVLAEQMTLVLLCELVSESVGDSLSGHR